MHGGFVWYDLVTPDPAAAARFYAAVVGWEAEPVPGMHYTLLTMGEARCAGLSEMPPGLQAAGVPPRWTGYIRVEDVDRAAGDVTARGGLLKFGPEDIPGVGRFAVMLDPAGAPFYLFQPTGEGQPPAMMQPGHVGWHELVTKDHPAAFAFYQDLFGWQPSRAIDMGPMGTYQLFAYDGADRGGMMNGPPGHPPAWLFYVVVSGGIDAARARIEQAGGTVTREPMEVPGGAWVVAGTDPQGAPFALVSAGR